MFRNTIKAILPITFASLITGCSVANLDSTYDKNKQTTYIQLGTDKTYIIPNSKKIVKRNSHKSLYVANSSIDVFTADGICSNFLIRKAPPLEGDAYYTTQAKSDVYKSFGKTNCTTQEINGLEFHDCKYKYAITYDRQDNDGFLTEKRYLYIQNEQCFEDIKRFVKGSKQEVTVKEQSFIDQAYSGVFNTTTPEKKNCIDTGVFEAKVVDNNLNGSFLYKDENFKNKKINFGITLRNNEFKYNIPNENIKIEGKVTTDNKFIGGTYRNGQCTGVFEASRF